MCEDLTLQRPVINFVAHFDVLKAMKALMNVSAVLDSKKPPSSVIYSLICYSFLFLVMSYSRFVYTTVCSLIR